MDPITQQTVTAAAGAGGDSVYVDDVFSTHLYTGTNGAVDINNGIDLAGEGGLVWIKQRTLSSTNNIFYDTERGTRSQLVSNSSAAADVIPSNYATYGLQSFNSNGFSLGYSWYNDNIQQLASWSFRKAPGFFDVVTYTGNGTAGRTVAHNLGSVPGMIIIKKTNATGNWAVYHRSLGNSTAMYLHTTGASFSSPSFNNTTPTSTEFTLNNGGDVNGNGNTYVAYIFAHDDASFGTDEDESIIKCGTYTGTGGTLNATTEQNGPDVNLGFEPQFVMVRSADSADNWYMFDTMRGFPSNVYGPFKYLQANSSAAEGTFTTYPRLKLTNTGFKITAGDGAYFNYPSQQYIYMAIRRPHKPPVAGTDVYQALSYNGNSADTIRSTNITVDVLHSHRTGGGTPYFVDRIRSGYQYMSTASTGAEGNQNTAIHTFGNDFLDMGGGAVVNGSGSNYILQMFKRAPGFFDVAAYKGFGTNTSTTSAVPHSLGVNPELIIVKARSDVSGAGGAGGWHVFHAGLNKEYLYLNTTAAGSTPYFITGTVSSSTFTVKDHPNTGYTGYNYIAYLFATLPGISKVGSYTGTGSSLNIDCGFTNGARFVLIKRSDGNGNWMVFNSVRGIVSGNDPYLRLNSSQAETTDEDQIDPYSAGFNLTGVSGDTNASGGTYIFLAIA